MPYRITRQDVIARIAMRALLDHVPGITQRQLAALFHASTRTVNDAAKHDVGEWYSRLQMARDAAPRVQPAPPPARQPAKRHYLADPARAEGRSFGKGDAKKARRVYMEDQGDDFDVDEARDEEGLEAELARQAKEAEKHG